jgi:phospholipid/cholesterol/gamma-HCH transport system substrate-binding protein
MNRASLRELRVGLVVVGALGALLALFFAATAGPGFLGPRRIIEVVFRDGQGVRVGCPVRVAGIDAGRVVGVQLFEAEDGLRVKLRLSLPTQVADFLKQDARIVVSAGLTGQSTLNIVSSGKSNVGLVAGQVLEGVESSLFDPIIEQIGLGPSERNHLQHTIAQVRETVDQLAPALRESLGALADTASEIRTLVADVRPRVQSVAAEIEDFAKNFDDATVAQTLNKVQALAAQADTTLRDLSPVVTTLAKNLDALAREARDITATNRPQIEKLIAGLDVTKQRLDSVLANSQIITNQTAAMLLQNRSDIERSLANVRDATGYGLKLVQKLYGNPFYLSPFYKPKPEDLRAEAMYDYADTFLLGAKEFNDALKSLQAMQTKAMSKSEQDAYQRLFNRAWAVSQQLETLQTQFAQRIQEAAPTRR